MSLIGIENVAPDGDDVTFGGDQKPGAITRQIPDAAGSVDLHHPAESPGNRVLIAVIGGFLSEEARRQKCNRQCGQP